MLRDDRHEVSTGSDNPVAIAPGTERMTSLVTVRLDQPLLS